MKVMASVPQTQASTWAPAFSERAVAARILGEVGRHQEMIPGHISVGREIAILVRPLNGSEGTPEAVTVLAFPANDRGVSLRQTQQGHEPGALDQAAVPIHGKTVAAISCQCPGGMAV